MLEHAEWPGSVSDWNLVFKETRLEDAGTYECQVIHTKRIMWRVTLNVIRTSSVDTLEGEDMRAGKGMGDWRACANDLDARAHFLDKSISLS